MEVLSYIALARTNAKAKIPARFPAPGALREFQFAECTDLHIRVKRFPGSIAAGPCAIGAPALPQILFDRPAPLATTVANLEFSTAAGIDVSFFYQRNKLGKWVG